MLAAAAGGDEATWLSEGGGVVPELSGETPAGTVLGSPPQNDSPPSSAQVCPNDLLVKVFDSSAIRMNGYQQSIDSRSKEAEEADMTANVKGKRTDHLRDVFYIDLGMLARISPFQSINDAIHRFAIQQTKSFFDGCVVIIEEAPEEPLQFPPRDTAEKACRHSVPASRNKTYV